MVGFFNSPIYNKDMNFKGTKELFTDRLILRKFNINDLKDFNEYASQPEVARFLTWYPHKDLEESKEILENKFLVYNNDTFRWAIEVKEENKLIGAIDVCRYNFDSQIFEIGYCINKNYWGKGYVSEALNAVTEYLFKQVLPSEIRIFCDIENPGSYHVMKKCGYKDRPDLIKVIDLKNEKRTLRGTSLSRFEYTYKVRY